jgi:SAM-dependent methyltransferase
MLFNKIDINIQHWDYLNSLYDKMNPQIKQNTMPETNGEILYPSVEKLLSIIPFTNKDIFLDLGSGKGRLVIQIFLNTSVKKTYGIELSPELHQQAIRAADKLLPNFNDKNRELTFLHGNFLTMPLPDATIVMINSTCFDQPMLHQLGKIINEKTSIHTVLTSRPINTLERLTFKKTISIECSWDTALFYVYS